MPRPEEGHSERVHKAVYWEYVRLGRDGQPVVRQPCELDVRWVETKRVTRSAQGQPLTIDAIVQVAQTILENSIMWRGCLAELPGTAAIPESNLMVVVTYDEADDMKGTSTAREVTLSRYHGVIGRMVH